MLDQEVLEEAVVVAETTIVEAAVVVELDFWDKVQVVLVELLALEQVKVVEVVLVELPENAALLTVARLVLMVAVAVAEEFAPVLESLRLAQGALSVLFGPETVEHTHQLV